MSVNNKYQYTDYKNYDYIISNKNKNIKFRDGLKIASINTRGIIASEQKRIDLLNWINLHDLDIICLQEWYLHHDLEDIQFDMSRFYGYNKIQSKNNTKTMILYKNILNIIKFDDFEINEEGLDITWIAISSQKRIIVIGSFYHSPSSKSTNYDHITIQIQKIQEILKKTKKQIIFQINGDFNAKNEIWGSSKTDKRGEFLLEWIAKNNMEFINDGSPTHFNSS